MIIAFAAPRAESAPPLSAGQSAHDKVSPTAPSHRCDSLPNCTRCWYSGPRSSGKPVSHRTAESPPQARLTPSSVCRCLISPRPALCGHSQTRSYPTHGLYAPVLSSSAPATCVCGDLFCMRGPIVRARVRKYY